MSSPSPQAKSDLQLATIGRWILGHQTFHVQLVAMLSVLERCRQSLEVGARPVLVRSLADLRRLLDASTANMIYTASFSPHYYEQVVRPSMMPPHLSPGFSGQLSLEHRLMMDEFKNLAVALRNRWGDRSRWPAEVAQAWKEVAQAIRHNRRHHGLVCQRFVPDGSSLLQDFFEARDRRERASGDVAV